MLLILCTHTYTFSFIDVYSLCILTYIIIMHIPEILFYNVLIEGVINLRLNKVYTIYFVCLNILKCSIYIVIALLISPHMKINTKFYE